MPKQTGPHHMVSHQALGRSNSRNEAPPVVSSHRKPTVLTNYSQTNNMQYSQISHGFQTNSNPGTAITGQTLRQPLNGEFCLNMITSARSQSGLSA